MSNGAERRYLSLPRRYILKKALIIFVFCTLILKEKSVQCQEVMETTVASEMRRLRGDLLKNYNNSATPTKDASTVMTVKSLLDIRHIINLDEKYQILSGKAELIMEWKDEHLKWDPSSYSSISSIRMKSNEIWTPIVGSMYDVKKYKLLDRDSSAASSSALLYSNGTVKWRPEVEFDIPCTTQLRHYPFDSHNCTILLNAWSMESGHIVMEAIGQPDPPPLEGVSWIVTKVEHEFVDSTWWRNFASKYGFAVNVFLQRTSRIYRYVCVAPTIITLLTSLFGFWLSPSDSSRYMIGCSNVILMSLCLQNLAATVPAGKDIPLIASYNAAFLCMSGLFLVVTAITNSLRESSGRASQAVLGFVRRHLERYLCVNLLFAQSSDRILKDTNSPLEDALNVSPEEEKRKKDWEYISIVVDRIFMYAFAVTYGILLAVLASV